MLGGGVSHPSQLTTGLVIKSVTTSPTLAGERMLFILQVSILSEQTDRFMTESQHPSAQASGARRRLRSTIPPSRYNLWQYERHAPPTMRRPSGPGRPDRPHRI